MNRPKLFIITSLVLVLGVAALYVVATRPLRDSEVVVLPKVVYHSTVEDAVTREECGACHMAFLARFLPARSWSTIMATLDDHFGEDASLDDASRERIESYLTANAGRVRGTPLRITELSWFVNVHYSRDFKAIMQRRGAKSAVDCMACHPGADRGLYDD